MAGISSNRRMFLATMSTTMMIAVAGCSDSGDGSGDGFGVGDDDTDGDDGVDDDDDTDDDEDGANVEVPREVQDWLNERDANNADAVEDRTGEEEVTIDNGVGEDPSEFAFDPVVIRINEGTTVTWEWRSDGHNVETEQTPSEPFESPIQNDGDTFTREFDEAGNVLYQCFPHAVLGHVGAIIVE